jgi:hypothetical protein
MNVVGYILNLPWTLVAVLLSVISIPTSIQLKDGAIVIRTKSFWWHPVKGVRAFALGNIIVLGCKLLPNDLKHEYVHIEQHMREPFIHPLLAFIETRKHGFRHSKYEDEAYTRAGNKFVER